MSCSAVLVALLLQSCVPHPAPAPLPKTLRAPGPTTLSLALGYDALSGDYSDWNDAALRVQRELGTGAGVFGEVVRARRFDLTDVQGRIGGNARIGDTWSVSGEAALTVDADVLPSYSVLGTVYRDLGGGFQLGVGGRHSDYETGDVQIATALLDRYFGNNRVGYTLSVGFVEDRSAPSHTFTASRYYGASGAITALLSTGEAVERTGPATLAVADILTAAFWGAHPLGGSTDLTYGVTWSRQEGFYDRTRGELGFRLRI